MEEENVAIRLKGYMDFIGLTNSQFADACGIPRPSLSQLLNGRNKKISDIIIRQVHTAFPDLSVTWLLFGEGPMTLTQPMEPLTDEADLTALPDQFPSERLPDMVSYIAASPDDFHSAQQPSAAAPAPAAPPRKVVSITVFYDDNSYETFQPSVK